MEKPAFFHKSGADSKGISTIRATLPSMPRPPDRQLLTYLAPYDPHISSLALALREIVLEEAPAAVESLVNGYAVAVGFSFTGKPLKDGFCHVVTYADHVNLGFNRGALLPDPNRILAGNGKLIRHLTFRHHDELERPAVRRFLQAAIEQLNAASSPLQPKKLRPETRTKPLKKQVN